MLPVDTEKAYYHIPLIGLSNISLIPNPTYPAKKLTSKRKLQIGWLVSMKLMLYLLYFRKGDYPGLCMTRIHSRKMSWYNPKGNIQTVNLKTIWVQKTASLTCKICLGIRLALEEHPSRQEAREDKTGSGWGCIRRNEERSWGCIHGNEQSCKTRR